MNIFKIIMIILVVIILIIVGYEFYKRMFNTYNIPNDDKTEGYISSCCPG